VKLDSPGPVRQRFGHREKTLALAHDFTPRVTAQNVLPVPGGP
jgi:hypothetical protein